MLTPLTERTNQGSLAKKMIPFLLRWVLGAVFLCAGITKAIHPDGFIGDLGRYQLLPEALVTPIALYLPYLEILVGLGLISGLLYTGALLLSGSLLGFFSIALVSAWCRGLKIDCACFGSHNGWFSSIPLALLRNCILIAVFLLLAMALVRQGQKKLASVQNL